MIDKTYISSIAPYMEAFIKYKHSLGWKYETSEYYLREFDRYYAANETEDFSLKDIIKKWIILRENECSGIQHIRVATIREFGKYLQLTGYPDYYVIPKKVCQKQTRTIPHFFTNKEIISFFYACDTLHPRKENLVRHLVLPMLYRLLYCCGVRTCEARLLKRDNVNLKTGYIDILNSKGLKNRRIFIPEDLKTLYMRYDSILNEIYPERTYFFPIKLNGCYSKQGVGVNFNKIWKAAGLGKPHVLSTDSVNLIIRNYANQAKIICSQVPEHVHCHLIRKTRAMNLYQQGMPLTVVMEMLGHENLSTTSNFYAFATVDIIHEAMKKTSSEVVSEEPIWKNKDIRDILYSLD